MLKHFLCIIFLFFSILLNAQELNILSWNIGDLPIIEKLKNNNNRIISISNSLDNSKFDIIILEEAFIYKSREIIKNKLKNYSFEYGPVNNKNNILRFNGGIWILSKIPLKVIKEITFKNSVGLDYLSKKGAILLEGEINNEKFQLIATHLQSSKSQNIQIKQLTEIYENLVEPYSNTEIPQIICGDFNLNIHSKYYYSILNLLNLSINKNDVIKGVTFDDINNDVYKSRNEPSMIDYILLRNSNNINNINRNVVVFKNKWKKGIYLSDHNAIEANIKLKNIELLTKK